MEPDIVTLAKGIGNGFPLGAVVTSSEISESLNSALHFNTFGGNPLACIVGSTVLDVSIFHSISFFTSFQNYFIIFLIIIIIN